jgi:hypothetical protein
LVDIVTVALLLTRVFVPITVVPRLNVTVPVGGTPPGDVTVAVNVTALPRRTGFCDEVSVVLVDATVTTAVGHSSLHCIGTGPHREAVVVLSHLRACRIGRRNSAVFPLPVIAVTSRSRPSIAGGIASD